MRTTDFLKDGVLTELSRDYDYSRTNLHRADNIPQRLSFVMSGSETTTTDEMIATMKRGLLLTRVSNVDVLDDRSQLYTGVTRDGLWLIENGKITKAVRNFRWTESPLFIFNNIESIGESVPTMTSWSERFPFYGHALQSVVASPVVPTLKINDFSFTSTIDAV
jgi:predicted Zn-dependent protease